MLRLFGDFGDEAVDFLTLGDVGRDGDGLAADVGERVEGCDGFGAGGGFARGDEDFGAAGLEEAGRFCALV